MGGDRPIDWGVNVTTEGDEPNLQESLFLLIPYEYIDNLEAYSKGKDTEKRIHLYLMLDERLEAAASKVAMEFHRWRYDSKPGSHPDVI